jgi:hypothetical protein
VFVVLGCDGVRTEYWYNDIGYCGQYGFEREGRRIGRRLLCFSICFRLGVESEFYGVGE